MEWEFPEDFDFGDMPEETQEQIEEWVNDWFDGGRSDFSLLDYVYDALEDYDLEPEDFWGDVYGPQSS